jgi:hypothetical protein
MSESATFKAAFPVIQSAIKVRGDCGGMRVQLDIPESEMVEAVKILAWRMKILQVTIEPAPEERQKYERLNE